MTRTQLIRIAYSIREKPVDSFTDSNYYGTVYVGLYNKQPMYCFFDIDYKLIAVYYRKVNYCIIQTDKNGAIAIKKLFNELKCYQKVMLYKNASYILIEDEQGTLRSEERLLESQQKDYSDLIPIPLVK